MTTAITLGVPVSRADLDVDGAPLGRGGQGVVYATSRAYDGHALVYKEYSAQSNGDLNLSALQAMITHFATSSETDRAALLGTFAWPLATVIAGGATTGFLMPAVPGGFYSHRARGNRTSLRLNEFQHLLNDPRFVTGLGFDLGRQQQIDLLISVASAIRLLHRNGYAVGDLSPRNLLFDPASAAVFFLDCDAMTADGRTVLPQTETPDWNLPGGHAIGTADSDRYKFGLLVLRLLAGNQQTRNPADLPPEFAGLAPLLQHSLADSTGRPDLGRWLSALQDVRYDVADRASSAVPTPPPVALPPEPRTRPAAEEPGSPARQVSPDLPPQVATPTGASTGNRGGRIAAAVLGVIAIGAWIVIANRSDDSPSPEYPPRAGVTTSAADSAPYSGDTTSRRVSTPVPSYEPTADPEPPRVTYEPPPEPEPAPPQTTPIPGPPAGPVSAGYTWRLMGPYSSTWGCDQQRSNWPIATSVCFMHDGAAYYWGMAQG